MIGDEHGSQLYRIRQRAVRVSLDGYRLGIRNGLPLRDESVTHRHHAWRSFLVHERDPISDNLAQTAPDLFIR